MARFLGIKFPFKKGLQSMPADVTDEQLIRENLIQIITTPTGARIMRPDFGVDAYALIFENTGEVLKLQLESAIRQAIGEYEQRVIVLDVDILEQDSEITITITYVVVSTQETDSVSVSIPSA
jgi:hypothetical protein